MDVQTYEELVKKYEDSQEFTLLLKVNPDLEASYNGDSHRQVTRFYTAIMMSMPPIISGCPIMCGALLRDMLTTLHDAGTVLSVAVETWRRTIG
jgi:hypothetical protein